MVDENKTEPATGNPEEGDKPKRIKSVEDADNVRKGMAEENERREAILVREEALMAERRLGGDSDAGEESIPKVSEEKLALDATVNALGKATGASWAKDEDK